MRVEAKIQFGDRTQWFSFEIPDDIIENYARENLNLITEEEAIEYVNDNPPEYDEP
jgi:hypothetical protein